MSNKLPLANKMLGQHFLNDQSVITKITSTLPADTDTILEIGPGPGILTSKLAQYDLPLYIIEKDDRMKEYIDEYVDLEKQNFCDALDFNYPTFLKDIITRSTWLVSNLPYNVGVPLMMRFLPCPEIKNMTLMLQKEVGQKVIPPSGKKNPSGSLMALFQTYFDVTTVCLVPPGAFIPPPKVDSIVIHLTRKTSPEISLENYKSFEKFLRNLYNFKRKQVFKVMKPFYQPEILLEVFETLSIERTQRAESFNLEQIQLLFKHLHTNK